MMKVWIMAFRDRKFSITFVLVLLYLLVIALITPKLFQFIQGRPGFFLKDPVLALLPPHDYSILIFSIIYLAIFSSFVFLIHWPDELLTGLLAYAFLTTFRFVTILGFPLEAPTGIILLKDPLVDNLFYRATIITKDLFFSGHTSILFLLFLLIRTPYLKVPLLIASCGVASLLLMQRAHYTIDIIAAPLFSYLSYRLSIFFLKRFANRDI
jgi:hypothetical protein